MDKYYWDKIFKEWYDLPKDTKVQYYRNPSDCSDFNYERLNPDHIGLIWGRQKGKNKNWIRVCKITISNFYLCFINYLKEVVNLFVYMFENIDVFVCVYSIFLGLFFYAFLLNIDVIDGLLCMKKPI
jgi:hypothetical protein